MQDDHNPTTKAQKQSQHQGHTTKIENINTNLNEILMGSKWQT